jgi:EAL domain-containing protein (putative c-di-GMP-specific phosphodiesterase class I)
MQKQEGTMKAEQRILVIDDESDIGEFITAVATAMGFHCEATTQAMSFLEKLAPDTNIVMLDLLMPGMDGIELLRLLGKRKCNANIILMSGVGKRTIESAQSYGQILGLSIVGQLQKPFRPGELEEILRRIPSLEPPLVNHPSPPLSIQRAEFQRALEHNEFVVYYQPQIDLEAGRVIGVEALVRWRHPERGLIYPDEFIGQMEKLGLIDELGWMVANRAMREIGLFSDGAQKPLSLSLNASVYSLRNLSFPDALVAIGQEHGLSACKITIEITETGLIKELSRTLDTLTRLRMKKVKISVDDFGTGYATMKQFKNIPATELKIDKSFVQEMTSSQQDRIMVRKTIEIGHELGMNVVAEGVETPEQLNLLRSYGCDSAQGYLFSRPIPAIELVNWLNTYRAQYPGCGQMTLFDRSDGGRAPAPSTVGISEQNGDQAGESSG